MRETNILRGDDNGLFTVKEAFEDGFYLIFVTFICEDPPSEAWKSGQSSLQNALETIHTNEMRYHFILDVSALQKVSLQDAINLHQVLVSNHHLIKMYLQCTAVVIANSVVQTVASALLDIVPPLHPVRFFSVQSLDKQARRQTHAEILTFLRANRRTS